MQDSYGNHEANCSDLIREVDKQRKVIEQQQFVLDAIKDWAYSEQKASVGYTKARRAIKELIRGMP